MSDKFSYFAADLPVKTEFAKAATLCNVWLDRHMSQFGDKGIKNFMMNQPVRAAKLLLNETDDCTDASVIIALLGPAKGDILGDGTNPVLETMARQNFGNATINLLRHMMGEPSDDPVILRDAKRLILVEGLSTMNDQLIGRKRIDRHHQVRWDILHNLEEKFAEIRGENLQLDRRFEADLKKSRAALEALDREAAMKKKGPTGPR